MEKKGDFIKLFRKFLDWEWYDSPNEKLVFLHILLKANWKDRRYRGVLVERGQLMISIADLARELGLTVQNVRSAVKNLKKTNEVTSYTEAKTTVFTVINYDAYQLPNKMVTNDQQDGNKCLTSIQQDGNKEVTSDQHIEEEREEYKEREERNNKKEIILFEDFWNLYGHKVGSKSKCEKKWDSLSNKVRKTIMEHVPIYKSNNPEVKYRKHPQTYLNQKVWESEGEWVDKNDRQSSSPDTPELEIINGKEYEIRANPADGSRERRRVGQEIWSNDSNYFERQNQSA